MRRTTFRRRRGSVVALVVAGAVALAGIPTAAAFALAATPTSTAPPVAAAPTSTRTATSPAPTPTPSASPGVLARTVGSGWRAAPRRVVAGHVFRVAVRASGGSRIVRLERYLRGQWRPVDRVVTAADGRAALAWRAPDHAGRVRLRVHVLRSSTSRALVTTARSVVVRPAPSAPSPTATSTTKPAPRPSASDPTGARLLTLVNRARSTARTCGGTAYPAVPSLTGSSALDRAASAYAAQMAAKDFFSHTGPDGSTMVSRLNAVGVRNVAMRENIAAGQPTPEAVMAAWLGSPGHCANLMAKDVHRIGLGRAAGGSYRVYWVQDFAG